MRTLYKDRESLLFISPLLKIVMLPLTDDEREEDEVDSVIRPGFRIEDDAGRDITGLARDVILTQQLAGPNFVTLELLHTPGYDGPFCVPGYNIPAAL